MAGGAVAVRLVIVVVVVHEAVHAGDPEGQRDEQRGKDLQVSERGRGRLHGRYI